MLYDSKIRFKSSIKKISHHPVSERRNNVRYADILIVCRTFAVKIFSFQSVSTHGEMSVARGSYFCLCLVAKETLYRCSSCDNGS